MKLRWVTRLSSVVLTLVLVGCNSPLLNHLEADALASGSQVSKPTAGPVDPKCPYVFTKASLCAELTWERTPTMDEDSTFVVRYWDRVTGSKEGPFVDPELEIFQKLWMPSMGHGAGKILTAHVKDAAGVELPGVYRSTNVYFSMPGEWQVRLQLRAEGKVVEEVFVPVSIH